MPVSRQTTEGLALQVAQVYADVETRLLSLMAGYLAQGADSPTWLDDKLAQLQMFRRRAQRLIAEGEAQAVAELAASIESSYVRGMAAAQGELDGLPLGPEDMPEPRQAEHSVAAMVASQTRGLRDLSLPITRAAHDAFRDVIVRVSTGTLTGATTRLADAQAALDRLASRGIRAFTDTSGREWELQSYVEMATRSTTAQAAIQGHMDRLEDAGISLFVVSDSPRECERCRPWEGKILARGPVSALQQNAVTGRMEAVRVDGTVEQARRDGLFHPGCTHNLSGYIHGATRAHQAVHDPAAYEAQQRQRQMERTLREWKRREAAAVTPEAKALAGRKVRAWQGAIRDYVVAHDLPRKRNRESISAAR